MSLPVHTRPHQCTHILTITHTSSPVHTCPHQCTHVLTIIHMSSPVHTCPHQCTHILISAHMSSPVHTRPHQCTHTLTREGKSGDCSVLPSQLRGWTDSSSLKWTEKRLNDCLWKRLNALPSEPGSLSYRGLKSPGRTEYSFFERKSKKAKEKEDQAIGFPSLMEFQGPTLFWGSFSIYITFGSLNLHRHNMPISSRSFCKILSSLSRIPLDPISRLPPCTNNFI